jgi:hypothetical protein
LPFHSSVSLSGDRTWAVFPDKSPHLSRTSPPRAGFFVPLAFVRINFLLLFVKKSIKN